MAPSAFIRAMHPKTEIRPQSDAIARVLKSGWVGQWKIHGHRAQVHLGTDPKRSLVVFNRQGREHRKPVPPDVAAQWHERFGPTRGWSAFDAEWLKKTDEFFVFDCLKHEGRILSHLTYLERLEYVPRDFIAPNIRVLPLLRSVESCLKALARTDLDYLEGLVFKSTTSPGFSDTSIVRCRRV